MCDSIGLAGKDGPLLLVRTPALVGRTEAGMAGVSGVSACCTDAVEVDLVCLDGDEKMSGEQSCLCW